LDSRIYSGLAHQSYFQGVYPMSILRIALNSKQISTSPLPDKLAGGRLLTDEIISTEVDPGCDPLGPRNVLALATGALAGWHISDAGRLSIGSKSPLTGGIKESNVGGNVADALAGLGYRAVVLTGALPADAPELVVIDETGVRFAPAGHLWGLALEEVAERLQAEYGSDYGYLAIGPTGEMGMASAAICVSDVRGAPYRFAARGGLGAVMGSKGVKAILVKKSKRPRPADTAFKEAVKAFLNAITSNPRVEVLRKYGTASTVMLVQSLGGLPTRNFSSGEFEEAERISGEAIYRLTEERGGEGTPTESCMAACAIQCSNIFPDADGQRLVAPIEYETLVMCGSNLGIGDLDTIARLNRLCNEYGLDTIEVGAALGVAAEAGVWTFGDGQKAIELLHEIGQGTVLGRLLGQGCSITGKVLGNRRIPAVKGQALSAYDPRGVKGTGVTFATTPQGGDHTAGLTVFAPVDHHSAEGQVQLSRGTQITRAAYDSLGLCVFLLGSTGGHPELITNMLNGAYGTNLTPAYLDQIGQRVIDLERDFNRRAGLTTESDRLPDFFYNEPLPPHGEVFDVPDHEIGQTWD
jgi:aldehyde:ferredoxin oxidoreductase